MNFNKLNVLVVDDHRDTQHIISLMLKEIGVKKVVVCNDGRQALDYYEEHTLGGIDLILCDWNMPEVSGLDLLKQLRSIDKALPFIMITDRGDSKSVQSAIDSHVTGYILKPFSSEELRKKMTLALSSK